MQFFQPRIMFSTFVKMKLNLKRNILLFSSLFQILPVIFPPISF